MRPDGSDLTQLTTTKYPNNDLQATYSPDGTRIGFVSDRRYDDFCCQDLFKMRTDGGQQQQIPTGSNVGVSDPSWGLSVGPTTAPSTAVPKAEAGVQRQARPSLWGVGSRRSRW